LITKSEDPPGPITVLKKVDSRRAELVVSRITATISIARQGPSAFLSLPAVPPYAARVHAWCKSFAKTPTATLSSLQNSG
jgi:hypothetical protein